MRGIKGVILTLVVSAALLSGCGKEDIHEEEQQSQDDPHAVDIVVVPIAIQKEIGLVVDRIEEQATTGTLTVPARLRPNQDLEAHVGSFLQGRVQSVGVNIGQRVRRGQELMQIEGLEIGSIKAGFLKAKANLDYARSTLQRQKSLAEQNVGSQKALLEAQAEYEKALAEFNGEDKKIHSIGLTDDDVARFIDDGSEPHGHSGGILPIKSPIDGVVVERNVVIGQLVDQTTTAFCIMNTGVLWADAQVYERDLAALKGISGVTLAVTAFPGEVFPGTVRAIGETIDEKTRTITVRAQIPNAARKLKPEMYGELQIRTSSPTNRLLVPTDCLVREGGRFMLFVAKNDSTFEMRPVRTGNVSGENTEILSGLQSGERVVLVGGFYLNSEWKKETIAEEGH